MPQSGSLFDGASARAHPVVASAAENCLGLSMEGGWSDHIEGRLLTKLSDEPGRIRLGRSDMDGWSLILDKPLEPELAALVPKGAGYGRWIDRFGLVPAAIVCAAITTVVVGVGYLAPQWVAPLVPMSWERKFGSAIVGDFGANRCRGVEGQRALDTLAEKIEPGVTHGADGIRIVALDYPIFNAIALPGGNIVVFQGALDQIEDPDALAGIVAHEIAHVRRRHVTEALIRQLGIGAVISMFAGTTAASAEQLLSLSFTRAHETEADSDAIEKLQRAHISPLPTGFLFEDLARISGEAPGYTTAFLSSHPLSGDRAKRFEAAERKGSRYEAALTDKQFNALKTICSDKPD